jgi:Tol biopolymer transport system component
VSGAGGEERLWKSDIAGPLVLHHWSNAGNYLLFVASDPKTALDLWMLPLKGDRKPFPWLQSEFDEVWGRFSPDDKWVAYRSNKSGKNEIYVQPFDPEKGASASGGETLVSRGGAAGMPRWRSDQKELYYLASDGNHGRRREHGPGISCGRAGGAFPNGAHLLSERGARSIRGRLGGW